MSTLNPGFFGKKTNACLLKSIIPACCPFRALVFSVIDVILTNPFQHKKLLTKLFKSHQQWFNLPKFNRSFDVTDKLNFYKNTSGELAKLTAELSFTLRQLVIEEWYTHPALYPLAFLNLSVISKWEQPINSTALQALATILNFSITLSVSATKKELPCRYNYLPNNQSIHPTQHQLSLNVIDQVYLPVLANIQPLYLSIQHKTQPIFLKASPDYNNQELIKRHLNAQNTIKQIRNYFKQTVRHLALQVKANQLNQKMLFKLYCHLMNQMIIKVNESGHGDDQQLINLVIMDKSTCSLPNKSLTEGFVNAVAQFKTLNYYYSFSCPNSNATSDNRLAW